MRLDWDKVEELEKQKGDEVRKKETILKHLNIIEKELV